MRSKSGKHGLETDKKSSSCTLQDSHGMLDEGFKRQEMNKGGRKFYRTNQEVILSSTTIGYSNGATTLFGNCSVVC